MSLSKLRPYPAIQNQEGKFLFLKTLIYLGRSVRTKSQKLNCSLTDTTKLTTKYIVNNIATIGLLSPSKTVRNKHLNKH